MKFPVAIPQTPILCSLRSRVYPTFRQLTPPLLEGARAQIMTQGPHALSTALATLMGIFFYYVITFIGNSIDLLSHELILPQNISHLCVVAYAS